MGVIALGCRVRDPARSRRRRRAHRRARRREGARLLRRDAAARSRAPRGRPRRDWHRTDPARPRRHDGGLARRARRAAAVAALPERDPRHRGRLRGRPRMGRRGQPPSCSPSGSSGSHTRSSRRPVGGRTDATAAAAPGLRPVTVARRRRHGRSSSRSPPPPSGCPTRTSSRRSPGGSGDDPRRTRLPRGRRVGARGRPPLRGPARLGRRVDRARGCSSRRTARSCSRRSRAEGGAAPTIVDIAPAAGWDEREAHDLYGVRFDGHEPLRPLVDHDLVLSHWMVPVRGEDAYQVAVGPIHAGVIESGHFRFHVVGDRILHLDARLFYKHRGLERAAEGSTLADGAALRRPRLRRVRGRERPRVRPCVRGGARARAARRARPRTHDPAGARADLEPPERRRRRLRRRRPRRRQQPLRRAHRARAAAQRRT